MSGLTEKACTACSGEDDPVTSEEAAELHEEIPDWDIVEEGDVKKLRRSFRVKNFAQALILTNSVGDMAEEVNHHPAILTEWGKVTVTWWTHAIKGLHQNDFIMAARTDELYRKLN